MKDDKRIVRGTVGLKCVWTSNIKLLAAGGRVRDDNSNNSSGKSIKMHQVCSKLIFYLVLTRYGKLMARMNFWKGAAVIRCLCSEHATTIYDNMKLLGTMGGNSALQPPTGLCDAAMLLSRYCFPRDPNAHCRRGRHTQKASRSYDQTSLPNLLVSGKVWESANPRRHHVKLSAVIHKPHEITWNDKCGIAFHEKKTHVWWIC